MFSNITPVVYLIPKTVEPNLTTPSLQLVSEETTTHQTTTSSETPGVQDGEKTDTSRSLPTPMEKVSAVFKKRLCTH